jgi:hypothetical protein
MKETLKDAKKKWAWQARTKVVIKLNWSHEAVEGVVVALKF